MRGALGRVGPLLVLRSPGSGQAKGAEGNHCGEEGQPVARLLALSCRSGLAGALPLLRAGLGPGRLGRLGRGDLSGSRRCG